MATDVIANSQAITWCPSMMLDKSQHFRQHIWTDKHIITVVAWPTAVLIASVWTDLEFYISLCYVRCFAIPMTLAGWWIVVLVLTKLQWVIARPYKLTRVYIHSYAPPICRRCAPNSGRRGCWPSGLLPRCWSVPQKALSHVIGRSSSFASFKAVLPWSLVARLSTSSIPGGQSLYYQGKLSP